MPVSKHRRKPERKSAVKRSSKRIVVALALYGPNDELATKMVATVINDASGEVKEMKKWYSDTGTDVRELNDVVQDVGAFITKWNPRSVVAPETIIGCPHEEGIDYPTGNSCPVCPFWEGRDRFTGEYIQ